MKCDKFASPRATFTPFIHLTPPQPILRGATLIAILALSVGCVSRRSADDDLSASDADASTSDASASDVDAGDTELDVGLPGGCVPLSPPRLSFGLSPLGQHNTQDFTLTNCSDTPQILRSIGLDPALSDDFGLGPVPPPGPLGPGATYEGVVTFAPTAAGAHTQRVLFEIEAGGEVSTLTLPVEGNAGASGCAVARISQWADPIILGEAAQLSGEDSTHQNPNGEIASWTWRALEIPEGSAGATFTEDRDRAPDDPSTPTVFFRPDVEGRYLASLAVEDTVGCRSETLFELFAQPSDVGLRLELYWPPEGDLDLHLRHPNAESWHDLDWACFSQSPQPDWGPDPDNSPTLRRLDSGLHAEIIDLPTLEITEDLSGPYQIGVFVAGLGDSALGEPRLRVIVDGDLLSDQPLPMSLMAPGDYFDGIEISTGRDGSLELTHRPRYHPAGE